MKFEKVLVTGTGGQLGSYTAAELKGHCEVHGFDARPARGDIPQRPQGITDPAAMAEACKCMDAVLHIAARPNIWSGTGDDIVRVNTMGVWTVLTPPRPRACGASCSARATQSSASRSCQGVLPAGLPAHRHGASAAPDRSLRRQ